MTNNPEVSPATDESRIECISCGAVMTVRYTIAEGRACGVLERKSNHIANARLVAAAPELLEALKFYMPIIQTLLPEVSPIPGLIAIQKAEFLR